MLTAIIRSVFIPTMELSGSWIPTFFKLAYFVLNWSGKTQTIDYIINLSFWVNYLFNIRWKQHLGMFCCVKGTCFSSNWMRFPALFASTKVLKRMLKEQKQWRRNLKTKKNPDVLLTGKLLPSTADMLLRVAGLLSRTFFLDTFSSLLLGGTYPSLMDTRMGSASRPSIHSSGSTAGSGPAVSGKRSSWKRSDCKRKNRGAMCFYLYHQHFWFCYMNCCI